jgi:hypothetical protein
MKITLTPEIERALLERARRQGTTVERLALDSLREQFVTSSPSTSTTDTLADFLKDHLGVLHSSESTPDGARWSEADGSAFAKGLLEKRRQGRL